LKTATAAGAALATVEPTFGALAAAPPAVPTVTLGKTGQAVTKLGMGTSWSLAPSFVQTALFSGVRYIDTSETYENGGSETVIGDVLERTKLRKEVYLVTKCKVGRGGGGPSGRVFDEHLDASLKRLKTDYADCYYIHGVEGRQIEMLRDPAVKAAFEASRRPGRSASPG
jgi:aryl-alcohol dehydrogenase-like predicted oxidoreductase